jgi:hypothetical protein
MEGRPVGGGWTVGATKCICRAKKRIEAHRVVRLVMYTTLGLLRWNSCIVARSSAVSRARASATSSGVPASTAAAAAIPASPASSCRGGCHRSAGGCCAGGWLPTACWQQGCKAGVPRAACWGRRAVRTPAAGGGSGGRGRSGTERDSRVPCHLQAVNAAAQGSPQRTCGAQARKALLQHTLHNWRAFNAGALLIGKLDCNEMDSGYRLPRGARTGRGCGRRPNRLLQGCEGQSTASYNTQICCDGTHGKWHRRSLHLTNLAR